MTTNLQYSLPADYVAVPFDRKIPLTQDQIDLRKRQALRLAKELGLLREGEPEDEVITCSKCNLQSVCRSAFDLYNTDGDCLESK